MWILGALLATSVAQAQPSDSDKEESLSDLDLERARVLFENGKRLYDEGSYEAAIQAWQACYDISERPALLFNLSNAHERLGNFARALELLNSYRAQAQGLDPEEHERLARKSSTLELRARNERQALPEPLEQRERRSNNGAGTALTVTGGVLLATGAALGSLALLAQRNARTECVELPDGLLCKDTASGDIGRAEQFGTLSVVALGVGGAGLLGGVSLLASGGRNPEASVEVTWTF